MATFKPSYGALTPHGSHPHFYGKSGKEMGFVAWHTPAVLCMDILEAVVWSDALVIIREGAGRIFRELSQSAGREI